MNFYSNSWKLLAAVSALAVCVSAQEKGMEMSVFRVPEYDNKGNMTAQLFGRHAEVCDSGEVKIDRLHIEFYKDGAKFATVESPFCFYNPQKREAYSDAAVSAVAEKIQITGRGFEWKPSLHSVRIFNDVHVDLENSGGVTNTPLSGELTDTLFSGVSTGTGGVVTITSKELFLDYAGKTVQFEGDIHVQNGGGTEMHCEKLKIPLGEGRSADFMTLPGTTESVVK